MFFSESQFRSLRNRLPRDGAETVRADAFRLLIEKLADDVDKGKPTDENIVNRSLRKVRDFFGKSEAVPINKQALDSELSQELRVEVIKRDL